MQIKQRLDALTSLRFFAAVMIVIHHSAGLFGIGNSGPPLLLWGQGVSFFFVLSGFILAYVYPRLETWPEIRQFWRARIARIWPALVASLFLAFWLLPLLWEGKTALANLLMVNAWIPYPKYFFSYNSPSWSISTEFFFYLTFPFLIWRWDRTWRMKLFASGLIVTLLIVVSNHFKLPGFVSVDDGLTCSALLYIHPAARLFEFVLGIFIASCWRRYAGSIQWSRSRASLYEAGVILLAVASMRFMPKLAGLVNGYWPGTAAVEWLMGSGSMFVFGLLIFVMAMERGWVTTWLSHPFLVLLGEISFSLYLLHHIFLRYYLANFINFPTVPNSLSILVFWIIVLLSSYLMWAWIEMPGRQLMLGRKKKNIHASKMMRESWHYHLNLNRHTLSAAAILTCLLVSIYFSMGYVNRISASEADAMTPIHLKSDVGTSFGGRFLLRGAKINRDQSGLHIELAWESLRRQKLGYTTGIHLTDADGKILVSADREQPMLRMKAEQGMVWKDTIFIAANKLSGNEQKLAIALYPIGDAAHLLPVDRGKRDWDNHRLLIDLNGIH